MTLEEIMKSDKAFLLCKDIAPVLGSNEFTLHTLAMDAAQRHLLGFPVTIIGNRVKIPRLPFLKFIGHGCEDRGNASLDI